MDSLLVAVAGDLDLVGQISVIGVADDRSERRKSAGSDIGNNGVGKVVYGGKIGEIELADRSYGMRDSGKFAAQLGSVGVII